MNDVKRKVVSFNDVGELQNWLDQCDADPENAYDIGEPITWERRLVVMYNIEPVDVENKSVCRESCDQCGRALRHRCVLEEHGTGGKPL